MGSRPPGSERTAMTIGVVTPSHENGPCRARKSRVVSSAARPTTPGWWASLRTRHHPTQITHREDFRSKPISDGKTKPIRFCESAGSGLLEDSSGDDRDPGSNLRRPAVVSIIEEESGRTRAGEVGLMSTTMAGRSETAEASAIERRTREIGRALFAEVGRGPSPLDRGWWDDRMMALTMGDPRVKVQLFRFIDALPALDRRRVGRPPPPRVPRPGRRRPSPGS